MQPQQQDDYHFLENIKTVEDEFNTSLYADSIVGYIDKLMRKPDQTLGKKLSILSAYVKILRARLHPEDLKKEDKEYAREYYRQRKNEWNKHYRQKKKQEVVSTTLMENNQFVLDDIVIEPQ